MWSMLDNILRIKNKVGQGDVLHLGAWGDVKILSNSGEALLI